MSTGTGACTQSQAGYYASDDSGNGVNTAAESQTICPEGHYSDVGATSCNIAQQGYFASDGDGKALVIPYQGAVGQTQVRAGHYAADSNGDPSSSGAIREEPCLLGFYSSDVGASQCTQVRAGYFTTDGAGTAVDTAAEAEEACSSGYFSSTAGASACTQVQAGYFATNGTGTGVNAAAVNTAAVAEKYAMQVIIVLQVQQCVQHAKQGNSHCS